MKASGRIGKAADFDSAMRRFESSHPSQPVGSPRFYLVSAAATWAAASAAVFTVVVSAAATCVIVVRYADDTIIGFEHQQDAERFLADLSARLAEFGLGLHPEKTRLIEFGRNAIANHRSRGLGKPKTFDFLGFTHYCATRRSGSGFVLGRTPIRSRMQTKLREIKKQLRATRHDGIEAQGQWLAKVLRGWLAYYAVPMSAPAITAFRHHLIERWLRAVRRRGQKHRLPWRRMKLIANRYLPYPRILHPWPEQRFLVTHPR